MNSQKTGTAIPDADHVWGGPTASSWLHRDPCDTATFS